MSQPGFAGDRAASLLLWNLRRSVTAVTAPFKRELEHLVPALCHTGLLSEFGFRSNKLPADIPR